MATEPLYTAGFAATSAMQPLEVVRELAEAMAGKVGFRGNKLVMRAGQYIAPTLDLGDNDFAAPSVRVQVAPAREELFNVVQATLTDPLQKWELVDMPLVEAAAYVAADGAELPLQIEYGAINHLIQAQQVSAVMLRYGRQALTVQATFKLTAYPLELFDTLRLTCSRYGWTNKPFEVLGRQWAQDSLVTLTLRETDPTIYAFGNLFDEYDVAPNTSFPSYRDVPAVTGLTVTSGYVTLDNGNVVTRTLVAWTAVTDESVRQRGSIELQYVEASRAVDGEAWSVSMEDGATTFRELVGLARDRVYLFRARARNALQVSGNWSRNVAHVVAGDAAASLGMQYRAVAKGLDDTQAPHAPGFFSADSDTLLLAPQRSYMLVKMRRSDGAVVFTRGYDVYGNGAGGGFNGAHLAAELNATGPDHIVCVFTYDEPQTNRLEEPLYSAMLRCGASRAVYGSFQFAHRSAYVLVAIAGCGEGNGQEFYNGGTPTDSWQDVVFQILNQGLYVNGGATPRTLQDYGYFGDLQATADVALVATSGIVTLAGNTATKTGGTAGLWDGEVRSADSVTGGAAATVVAGQSNKAFMFGLNSDPASSPSWESIDYGIYARDDGLLDVVESGSIVSVGAPYTGSDHLMVLYDGAHVSYQKNGVVFRTVDAALALTLFFDASLRDAGTVVRNIRLLPLPAVANIGTSQVRNRAIMETGYGQMVDYVVDIDNMNHIGYAWLGIFASVRPFAEDEVHVTASWDIEINAITGNDLSTFTNVRAELSIRRVWDFDITVLKTIEVRGRKVPYQGGFRCFITAATSLIDLDPLVVPATSNPASYEGYIFLHWEDDEGVSKALRHVIITYNDLSIGVALSHR